MPLSDRPAKKRRPLLARIRYKGVTLLNQAGKPLQDYFLRKVGLTPMGDFDERDVFLNSYPKSGSTWLTILMLGLVYGYDPRRMPYQLGPKLMPDYGRIPYYARFTSPMYFKSHVLPQPAFRRVIYLMRDGRDAMVSFLHQARAIQHTEFDIAEIVHGKGTHFRYDWHEHVEAWLSNPYHADMLILKYEDLKAEPVDILQKVCGFLGIVRDQKDIQRIVAGASFDRMRKKEQSDGPPIAHARWPAGKSFVRRGQVGSYQDEMSEAALADFMAMAGDTLRKVGYV